MKLFFSLLATLASAAIAQDPAPATPKEVSPGVFEIGGVRLDKQTKTVTVPSKLNMAEGLLEYLAVTPKGSAHESLLVSEAEPVNVHLAMVLLGAKGAELTPEQGSKSSGQIDAAYLAKAPKLSGDRVFLTVKWKDTSGIEHTAPVENWLSNEVPKVGKKPKLEVVPEGPWLYSGSFFVESRFIAQSQGSFVSIITDPAALINNPRPGSNDDRIWVVNKAAVPPVGTPVELLIKLEDAKETQK